MAAARDFGFLRSLIGELLGGLGLLQHTGECADCGHAFARIRDDGDVPFEYAGLCIGCATRKAMAQVEKT